MQLPLERFRSQIVEAKKHLAVLMREQQAINQQITDLRELIRANVNFLPDDERELELTHLEFLKPPTNITEAVRFAIFSVSILNLKATPTEIKALAEHMGFDFSEYSNPMASIHSILKRMKEAQPPQVDYDDGLDAYWFGENILASSAGDAVNPDFFTNTYNEAIKRIVTGMDGNKFVDIARDATKSAVIDKMEGIRKRRKKD
jgi:hypothetical protein